MSTCRLCGKSRELRNSHIVPEFLYKDFYNEKHQMMGINGHGSRGWKPVQKGLREKLLCDDCEQLLNDEYEKPFLSYWRDSNPIPARLEEEQVFSISVPSYQQFKLFHLSVFFRASVSTEPTYREASLGDKHEERLRELLLNRDAGRDWEYLIFGYVLIHHETKEPVSMISQPFMRRMNGNRCISMIYGGLEWCMTVLSHRPKNIVNAALSIDGSMPVMAIPWNSHEVESPRVFRRPFCVSQAALA